MAQFIHLFDENDAAKLKKNGIKVVKSRWRHLNGVFVFPQTENFVVNHQWMRELRRDSGQSLLAARVRIDDEEMVMLGKYNEKHIQVSAAEAIGIARKHKDPMGLEVIIPRSIKPREIQSIYRPPKVVGWRYYPSAHRKRPCGCEYCQRGKPFSKKLRDAYEKST